MFTQALKQIYYQLRHAIPLWFVQMLTNWLPENRITIRLRGVLVKPFLGKCGKKFQLARGVTFLNSSGIEIGDNVYIATGCWVDGIGGLIIEDEVELSPYVVMATSSHCFKNNSVRFGGSKVGSITIGKGCWIASHAVIAAGAIVGSGTIIGANSVVSGSIPQNIFAGGVPAKVIGPRNDEIPDIYSRFDKKAIGRENV